MVMVERNQEPNEASWKGSSFRGGCDKWTEARTRGISDADTNESGPLATGSPIKEGKRCARRKGEIDNKAFRNLYGGPGEFVQKSDTSCIGLAMI